MEKTIFNLEEALNLAVEERNRVSSMEELATLEKELEEAQIETEKTLDILSEFYTLSAAAEGSELLEEVSNEELEQKLKTIADYIAKSSVKERKDPISDPSVQYRSKGGVIEIEKPSFALKDLFSLKNISLIIKALAEWIKNKVVLFLAKLKNAVRALFGKTTFDIADLKEKAQRGLVVAKKIKTYGTTLVDDSKPRTVLAYKVDASQVNLPEETRGLFEAAEPGNPQVVISIDLSKDLLNLRELVQHFFDLSDNAFGSNGEAMFETEDLELLLNIIKQAYDDLSKGRAATYDIEGIPGEVEAVSSEKAKTNLMNTKINTDSLRKAFTETSYRAKDILRIIGHKELVMAADAGTAFKFYSEATYNELINIINVIEARLSAGKELESKMTEVQKKYSKLAEALQKQAIATSSIGTVAFTTIYQRRLSDLLQATKYMTQTTTLRLTALTIYLRELEEVETCLNSIADFSKPKTPKKFLF